jgi:hypothetical protein
MYNFSSIPRSLELKNPTNLGILLLTGAMFAGGLVVRLLAGDGWLASAWWGVLASLTIFLAWALARELDPDHAYAAFAGVGLSVIGVLLWGPGDLLFGYGLMLLLRVVNRITGVPGTLLDSLGVIGLGALLVLLGNWGLGLLAALALVLDGWLPGGSRRQVLLAGISALVTLGIAAWRGAWLPAAGPDWTGAAAALGLALVFTPVVLGSREIRSLGDATQTPLAPRRVQAGQLLALLAGLELALWRGTPGLLGALPLWAAVVGLTLAWAWRQMRGEAVPPPV